MGLAASTAASSRGGATPPTSGSFDTVRHRYSIVVLFSTFLLIGIGALVTSTNSGLAVPDWPLSYGMWLPPMVGGVFFEHGHRMAAGLVGLLTVILAIWTHIRESRRGVRILGWTALVLVVAQGLLGGLTVVLLLPTSVSVAHACLAQTFFCTIVAYVFATSREWLQSGDPVPGGHLRGVSLSVAALAFTQLFLGAIMRHLDERSWAAETTLPIPDFPLSLGRVVPPLDTFPVAVHFAHRVGALVVLGAAIVLWVTARRARDRRFSRPAAVLILAILLQGSLGAASVLTRRGVIPTSAHVVTGAFILGLAFFLTLRAFRHTRPEPVVVSTFSSADPVRS